MKLYTGLTQTIEPFVPLDDTVKIYVCGITPYDTTHLGHAFTYTVNDILIRYLEYQGRDVLYAQNVTDIDDDILRKAREIGDDWKTLGNYWTAFFMRDMQSLNVRPPEFYPRATEFIDEIVRINEALLSRGLAYTNEGNVYFHVDAWPEFGKLSRLPRAEMMTIANQRGNRPDDPHKQHPLDFVLWQAQAPGEPAWDSPWGAGRPGWHIECSAMASTLLGEKIDIHSGGGDLLFPHHECEIAQLEPVTGEKPFVKYWLHVAMVYHQGEKMSKSLGNLIMMRDLLRNWTPDALRVYLAIHHYRKIWSHDETELARAGEMADCLKQGVSVNGGKGATLESSAAKARFEEAMDNDLDTAAALAVLEGFAGEIVSAANAGMDVGAAQEELRRMSGVFGLRLDQTEPEKRVSEGWERHLAKFV